MNKKNSLVFIAFICSFFYGFGQTEIFNLAGGGAFPSGWTETNNVTAQDIDRGSYYLVDAGNPSDLITTAIYDLSTYSSAEFTLDIASFGSGSHNQAKIEISFDGGSSFTQTEISNTTTGTAYIDGGTFTLNSITNQVQIRISNNGTSEKGVRLRDLILTAISPAGCSILGSGIASLACNDNGTNSDATDDYITFDLNPTGTILGATYSVSVSSGTITPNTGISYGSATTFTLQNGSAGAGDVTVTVTDVADGACTLDQLITDPGSCSIPPSSCTPIFTDDFTSGGLTSPLWQNTTEWTETGGELQHNFTGGTDGDSYIYTDLGAQNLAVGNYEWNFCMRNDNWDPSTNNNFTYYLISDSPTYLDVNTVNGYAVGINRTGTAANDAITLYDVTGGNHSVLISSLGSFDWDNNDDVCVRVTRNSSGLWELFYNPNGTGEVSAGTISDTSHTTGQYTGAFFEFTSSNANELWVDNISICADIVVTGPELQLVAGGNDVNCGYLLDFGNVESDGSTLDISIFVDNDGSSALDINSLTIAGGNAGDFSIVSPLGSTSVAPGGTQEIVIKFTSNTNGLRTSTLTIDNTDGSDGNNETICTVILNGTGVTNTGGGALMITQYYEGSGVNKWIEIVNVSGNAIPAGSYYLAVYNKGGAPNYTERPLNGTPNASVSIPALAIDEIIRFKEPLTVLPAYAVPGETGYDGGTTYNMMVGSFSGDDIIIISPTNDASSHNLRIDIIGEYSTDGENWGNRRCLIRKECVASNPSITFDINEWIEFTDAEVENPINGTNPYLGQHYRGVTKYTGSGTYSGWDNGLSERSRIAEVSANYDTSINGSFEACSLEINSTSILDIKVSDYISIVNDLTTDPGATLNVEHEGSLVMVDDSGVVTNNGTTNVYKTTSSMEEFDYLYWSSPVYYGNITPFPTPIAFVLTDFNPSRMYEFNTSNFNDADNNNFDDNEDDWINYSSDMKKGIGYAAMTSSPGVRNTIFSGEVNNGVITVNVGLSADLDSDPDVDEDDWNLIGNPYPSAISADDFIAHNSNLNGTIYFWTHVDDISLSNPGPDAYNFSTDDYAMYNTTGGIGTSSISGSNAPTGFIASGQGFFVDAISAGTIEFKNSMRSLSYANDDFFRTNNITTSEKKDRIWLNLTNSDGAFSQILIGFFDDATLEKDRIYDGTRIKGTNYLEFYSLDNTTLEYGIQGRPSFDIHDNVLLGFESHIVGSQSIELGIREGTLLNTPIYLLDKYLMTSHDLTISPYVFNTETGKFNDRFEIVFTEDALSLGEVNVDNNLLQIIELQNGDVQFKVSSQFEMKSIEIIDLLGRTLYKLNAQGDSQIFTLSSLSQATYLAKVELTNGHIITKKALKRR